MVLLAHERLAPFVHFLFLTPLTCCVVYQQMMFTLEEQAETKAVTAMLVGFWAFSLCAMLSGLHWLFGDNQELCLDAVLWLTRHGVLKPEKVRPTKPLVPLRQQVRARVGSAPQIIPSANRPVSFAVDTPDAVPVVKDNNNHKPLETTLKAGNETEELGGSMAMAHAAATVVENPVPKEIKVDWDRDTKNLDKPLRKEGPVRYV